MQRSTKLLILVALFAGGYLLGALYHPKPTRWHYQNCDFFSAK